MHIDFETYSSVDLKERGLANYAMDQSTGIHCMAYAMGDEDPDILTVFDDCPAIIRDWVESGKIVYAHNAAFELALWNAKLVPQGWPPLLPEQMRCTLAMAYAMSRARAAPRSTTESSESSLDAIVKTASFLAARLTCPKVRSDAVIAVASDA